MHTAPRTPWLPRLSALVVGLLLAGSIVAWFLRWPAADGAGAAAPLPVPEELPPPPPGSVARLLGGQQPALAQVVAAPDAASRFRLTGIIAAASGNGQGVALLSIDGKPARPYAVGSALDAGWMLQSVEQRAVALATDAHAPVGLRLELPRQP